MFKLPNGVDIDNLIDDLRILSWQAADILLHYSEALKGIDCRNKIIKNKDLRDPVTKADLEVNDLILKGMYLKYPDIGWKYLSEENVKIAPSGCDIDSDWVWVLDPLDGTKDFIQGTGDYAMHFALNYKNKPFIGVVLIPEKDELWISNNENVWCEKRNGSSRKINLTVQQNLSNMTLATSKNHSNQTLKKLIEMIKFKQTKIMGSIGCKIASIIRGECDIYICLSLPKGTCPKDWDFAAPESILKAAGGDITNLENEELIYGDQNFEKGGIIIASNNKRNHHKICLEIKKIILKNNLYPLNTLN